MSKRVGRNDPCTCGSGKKYKKCCGKTAVRASLADRKFSVQGAKANSLLERITGGSAAQAVEEDQESAPEEEQRKGV